MVQDFDATTCNKVFYPFVSLKCNLLKEAKIFISNGPISVLPHLKGNK